MIGADHLKTRITLDFLERNQFGWDFCIVRENEKPLTEVKGFDFCIREHQIG